MDPYVLETYVALWAITVYMVHRVAVWRKVPIWRRRAIVAFALIAFRPLTWPTLRQHWLNPPLWREARRGGIGVKPRVLMGADTNYVQNGVSVLEAAVESGNVSTVWFLVQFGADPSVLPQPVFDRALAMARAKKGLEYEGSVYKDLVEVLLKKRVKSISK